MSWQGWLAFTLYVGAANYDANPQQREQLRDRIRPLLEEMKEDGEAAKQVLVEVGSIMGSEWRPTGDWDTVIKNMLNRR